MTGDLLFTASTTQIAHIAQVLQSITSAKTQALLQITNDGINLVTENNHICKIRLSLDKTLFSSYNLQLPGAQRGENDNDMTQVSDDEDGRKIEIGIDLNSISDCFNMANQSFNAASLLPTNGGTTLAHSHLYDIQCIISYRRHGDPLVIDFKDGKMNEKVEFSTFHIDETLQQDMVLCIDHSMLVYELMIKSDVFHNILKDLKDINTEDLFIYVSNMNKKRSNESDVSGRVTTRNKTRIHNELNFISRGEIGYSKMMFPQERSILEQLTIYKNYDSVPVDDESQMQSAIISRYNYPILSKIIRPVRLSHKTKIMKDSQGLMSFHLLINNHELNNYQGTIIEFNILEMNVEEIDLELNTLLEEDSQPREDEDELSADIQPIRRIIQRPFSTATILETENETTEPSAAQSSYEATAQNIQVNDSTIGSKRRHEDDDDRERQLESYGGAVEVPLFF